MATSMRMRKATMMCSTIIFGFVWLSLLYVLDSHYDYFEILFPEFKLESSSQFEEEIDELFWQKSTKDVENRYWISNPTSRETSIVVPSYYMPLEVSQKKPPIQIFDPRLTLGVYINSLMNKNKSVPFSWYDWVDMSKLHKYLLAKEADKPHCNTLTPLTTKFFCRKQEGEGMKTPRIGFSVFTAPAIMLTEDNSIIAGNSYLYEAAAVPKAIIFNSPKGLFKLETSLDPANLLQSDLVAKYVDSNNTVVTKDKKIVMDPVKMFQTVLDDEFSESRRLQPAYAYPSVNENSFVFDVDGAIKHYEDKISSGITVSQSELDYFHSLLHSKQMVQKNAVTKYFNEVKLSSSKKGGHYDWRFFSGVKENPEEVSLLLHRLIRNWLLFSRKAGLNTWIAHGSLLSWYWNGVSFPWDDDIDVQMPIQDLHELAKYFNQTVFVEDVNEGFGRYFIDIGLSISLREYGNGLNNIDARFIDMDTGLYIDITGLSLSRMVTPPRYMLRSEEGSKIPKDFKFSGPDSYKLANQALQVFNCRNGHFSQLQDIIPLRKVSIEGEWGFIPNDYAKILSIEYNYGMLQKAFGNHIYIEKLRLWVKDEDLQQFLSHPDEWMYHYDIDTGIFSSPTIDPDKIKQNQAQSQQRNKIGTERIGINDQKKLISTALPKVSTPHKKRSLTLASIHDITYDDLVKFLMKDDILLEYCITRDFTAYHEQEIIGTFDTQHTSTGDITLSPAPFKPFRHDHFQYNLHIDHYDYETYISDTLKLVEKYAI